MPLDELTSAIKPNKEKVINYFFNTPTVLSVELVKNRREYIKRIHHTQVEVNKAPNEEVIKDCIEDIKEIQLSTLLENRSDDNSGSDIHGLILPIGYEVLASGERYIVETYGRKIEGQSLYEFVLNQEDKFENIKNVFETQHEELDPEFLKNFIRQIAISLDFLHLKLKHFHNDLDMRNIMYDKANPRRQFFIIDFDRATEIVPTTNSWVHDEDLLSFIGCLKELTSFAFPSSYQELLAEIYKANYTFRQKVSERTDPILEFSFVSFGEELCEVIDSFIANQKK